MTIYKIYNNYTDLNSVEKGELIAKSDTKIFICAWKFLIKVKFIVNLVTTWYSTSLIMNKDIGEC